MSAVEKFGKVAVLMGGRSAEREISLRSGRMVLAALQRKGQPIGSYDVLIAGCALARGLIVVTSNLADNRYRWSQTGSQSLDGQR